MHCWIMHIFLFYYMGFLICNFRSCLLSYLDELIYQNSQCHFALFRCEHTENTFTCASVPLLTISCWFCALLSVLFMVRPSVHFFPSEVKIKRASFHYLWVNVIEKDPCGLAFLVFNIPYNQTQDVCSPKHEGTPSFQSWTFFVESRMMEAGTGS